MKKYIVKNNFYFAGLTKKENIEDEAKPFEKKKSVIIMTKLQIKELEEIDRNSGSRLKRQHYVNNKMFFKIIKQLRVAM